MRDHTISLSLGATTIQFTFDLDSPVHHTIAGEMQQKGAYEPGTTKWLGRVLRPGDVFVDVGAHIGYFSLIAAAMVGPSGKVISVEPVDENFARLSAHKTANGLAQMHCVQAVVSDSDGEATLHINKDNDGGHALWDPRDHPANDKTRAEPEARTVRSTTLPALLDDHGCTHVRLMKIDTEGAEPTVLRGAADILRAGAVDFIVAEVNAGGLIHMGDSVDTFFALARDLGFVICLPRDDGAPPPLLLETNRPDEKFVYNVLLVRPEALASL